MTIRKVQPGETFAPKATTWNAFSDAARAHQARATNPAPQGAGAQWLADVRNTSETDTLQRFDAVELLGPTITDAQNDLEFDRMSLFDVAYPEDELVPGQLAIVQETIAPGRVGRALIFGVSPARELVVESEDHTRARYGSQGQLVSAQDGPGAILWKSDSSQQLRRAIVAIGAPGGSGVSTRFGRIVTSSRDLDSWRWDYTVELVELDPAGDFQAIPDLDLVAARNTIEASNTSTGPQGNGVDADQLPAGFEIVPVGGGAVVELSGPYGVVDNDPGFYLFSVANLVDGSCKG